MITALIICLIVITLDLIAASILLIAMDNIWTIPIAILCFIGALSTIALIIVII